MKWLVVEALRAVARHERPLAVGLILLAGLLLGAYGGLRPDVLEQLPSAWCWSSETPPPWCSAIPSPGG